MPRHPQGIYWIGTIPDPNLVFPMDALPDSLSWIRGQLELGAGGFRHWQVAFAFSQRSRLAACTLIWGPGCHFELSRSSAVRDYVWKDDTSLGERFEFGEVPVTVSSKTDWAAVWESAKSGDLDSIPVGIRVRSYNTLRTIASDFGQPLAMVRQVWVYWGTTGSGKSRRAWDEAGDLCYGKCPRTKFWCGYRNEKNVVIDEFRGGIDVSHLLRWFDRYPVRVEIKGSTRPFNATTIWITSNLHPRDWYPDLDGQTTDALMRRLTILPEFTLINDP